jgi:hypothetical protein
LNWTLFPFHKLFFSLTLHALFALLLDLNLNLNSVFVCLFYLLPFCLNSNIFFFLFCSVLLWLWFLLISLTVLWTSQYSNNIILVFCAEMDFFNACCWWLILMRWFIHFLHSGIVLKSLCGRLNCVDFFVRWTSFFC